jgi:uncharacterized protein (DUF433 family)
LFAGLAIRKRITPTVITINNKKIAFSATHALHPDTVVGYDTEPTPAAASAGLPSDSRPSLESGIMCSMPVNDKAALSRITVVPGLRSGQPCIRGLRVTVWDVLDMLASGMTEDEILEDFPYLEKADFPAVYAYASQAGRERISR